MRDSLTPSEVSPQFTFVRFAIPKYETARPATDALDGPSFMRLHALDDVHRDFRRGVGIFGNVEFLEFHVIRVGIVAQRADDQHGQAVARPGKRM